MFIYYKRYVCLWICIQIYTYIFMLTCVWCTIQLESLNQGSISVHIKNLFDIFRCHNFLSPHSNGIITNFQCMIGDTFNILQLHNLTWLQLWKEYVVVD